MNENVSRLMDGEVDAQEFDLFCAEMKSPEAMNAWACYHVIGDQLRGAHGVSAGFATRFREVLAAFHDMVTEEVEWLRGRAESFIGDAVLAVWPVTATRTG